MVQAPPYSTAARMSSLLRPSLSPTTKAAAEPASAPSSEELTTKPDWNEVRLYLITDRSSWYLSTVDTTMIHAAVGIAF